MSTRIYLNKQLKDYYKYCLEEEIRLGKIDKNISNHLLTINKSKNIAPVFSKKGKNDITNNYFESYLRISFFKHFENLIIKNIGPKLEQKYSIEKESEFMLKIINPYVQIKRVTNEKNRGAKWLTDPYYFNINQIEFKLSKGDDSLHNSFWNDLSNLLSEIE